MRSRISSLLILILILAFTMQCVNEESKLDMEKIAEAWRTAYNNHDADTLAKIFTDDIVLTAPFLPEPLEGKKEVMDVIQSVWEAMPDFKIEIKVLFTSDEHFAWEIDLRGTFTNALISPQGEIAPTGKEVILPEVGVVKVTSEGLVSEIKEYYDPAVLLKQLGVEQ